MPPEFAVISSCSSMNRRTMLKLPVALSVGSLSASSVAVAASGALDLGFRRGVNIHNLMNWPALASNSASVFAWPPYQGAPYEITTDEIIRLRQVGFDFVRLTLQPGIFMQADDTNLRVLSAYLLNHCERFLQAGLGVIVDLHPVQQVSLYSPDAIVLDPDSPLTRRYGETIGFIAKILAPYSNKRVAFELLNEPAIHSSLDVMLKWPMLVRRWHDLAREVAPDLFIVLSGGLNGGVEGLTAFDPSAYRFSRVIYSFHQYAPSTFTLQAISPRSSGQYMIGVPWPPEPADERPIDTAKRLISQDSTLSAPAKVEALDKVRDKLLKYNRWNFGPSGLEADFDRVAAWADRNGIARHQVLMGEFGVTRTYAGYQGASDPDRAHWLRVVRTGAEAKGFAWAIWVYKANSIGLVDEGVTRHFDPVAMSALGLAYA